MTVVQSFVGGTVFLIILYRTVLSFFLENNAIFLWFLGSHYKEIPKFDKLPTPTRDILVQCISINSSYASQVVPAEKPGDLPKQLGNKTECGLLGFVLDMGQQYQPIRDVFTEDKFTKVLIFYNILFFILFFFCFQMATG